MNAQQQQRRELASIMNVIKPAPPAPADDLAAAKEKIAELEKKLAEAKAKPTDRAASDAVQMRNKQAIGFISDELHWALRHLEDLKRRHEFESFALRNWPTLTPRTRSKSATKLADDGAGSPADGGYNASLR
jgi:hypothetical protein